VRIGIRTASAGRIRTGIFIIALLIFPFCISAQNNFHPGTWRTHNAWVNFIYDLDSAGNVYYHYRSEFREHDVKGTCKLSHDTLFISYLPFITAEPLDNLPGDTLHLQVFRQDSGTFIPHADFQVFYKGGKRSSFYADEKGMAHVPGFSNIDSVFFVREFCNMNGQSLFAIRKPQLSSDHLKVTFNVGAWQLSRFGQGHAGSLAPDTLVIVNKDKLRKLHPATRLFSRERKEKDFSVSKVNRLNYEVDGYAGDLFLLEIKMMSGWMIIDTVKADANGHVVIKDHPLELKSGKNEFHFTANDDDPYQQGSAWKLRSFEVNSAKPKVKLLSPAISDTLRFSDSTWYDLVSIKDGKMKKRGFGKTVDCSGLEDGSYQLSYENTMVEIRKQKRK
jgi:hypothetical protein